MALLGASCVIFIAIMMLVPSSLRCDRASRVVLAIVMLHSRFTSPGVRAEDVGRVSACACACVCLCLCVFECPSRSGPGAALLLLRPSYVALVCLV